MALAATVYIADPAETRSEQRTRLAVGATVRGVNASPIEAAVRDVSRAGCLVAMAVHVEVGSLVSIGISGIGRVDARVVRRADDLHGCEFLRPISRASVSAAQDADTVVSFTGQGSTSANTVESTMASPDRWSPKIRFALLIAGAAGPWAAILGVFHLL